MKKIASLLPALCLFAALSAQPSAPATDSNAVKLPAPLFRIYESDRYNPAAPTLNTVPNNGIVEINGTLVMSIDRDEIHQQMQAFAGVKPADITLLSKYKTLLLQKTQALQLLQEGLASADGEPNFEKLQALSMMMDEFYTQLLDDPELKSLAAKALADYKQKVAAGAINKKTYPIDMYFYDYFGQATTDLAERLQDAENVKFILSGKIRNQNGNGKPRPVHIGDDFDDIPEETFVVPRWVISLSDDQKQELRDISQISDKLNKLRNQSAQKSNDAVINSFECKSCIDDIRDAIDSLPSTAKSFTDTMSRYVMATIKPIQDQLIVIQDQYLKATTAASGLTGSEQLIGFNDKVVVLQKSLQGFFKDLPKTLDKLPSVAKNTPQVQGILALKDSCYARFMRDFNRINSFIDAFKAAFGGGEAEERFHATISDQVKRLAFTDIPQESHIDLTQTGNRQNGDKLVLQAFLQVNNAGTDLRPQQIFRQEIILQQIAMYSDVKVNMILANPEPDLPNQKHQYVFSPSYSVMLRWGSRKSRFYNEFLNIGLGLNFSAPDFDLDGVPEFGAAFAVSTMKDFLSAGYGYDFGVDAKYFFIGFRVPFASSALPIFNNIEK